MLPERGEVFDCSVNSVRNPEPHLDWAILLQCEQLTACRLQAGDSSIGRDGSHGVSGRAFSEIEFSDNKARLAARKTRNWRGLYALANMLLVANTRCGCPKGGQQGKDTRQRERSMEERRYTRSDLECKLSSRKL